MARNNKLIQFYLTNICNSKCKTCQIWQNKNLQEIPVNKVLEIIHDFPDADYVFGGGEFTLYSQKHELLNECDANGINYTILSNAVSFRLLDQVLQSHQVKNLTISCDGKHHDSIRGKLGNRENIETIIKMYRDKIPNIKLSYTLSKFNEISIDNDMQYFKSLGFDKIYFCIAQNMDLLKADGDITPEVDRLRYFYDAYSDMLYDKDKSLLYDLMRGVHRTCDSINNVHTIYTNGDVVRCQSFLSSDVLGNINHTSFKEIIGSLDQRFTCPYNNACELVCQRRYDYEESRL